MMWLTWRQFRAQAITAVAALAAFAIALALTESHMASMYDSSGLLTCHRGTCPGLATTFLVQLSSGQGVSFLPVGANVYVLLYFLSVLVILVAPAIIGIFWGAPLIARELEAGTVGLGGGASIFSEGRFGWFVFPSHGITPLGYAAFAFALGVTAGLVIRRPLPAMAATLAIFAAFQALVPLWIRPNLFPTSQTTATIAASGANVGLRANPALMLTASIVPGQPGAWIISSEGVNAAGQPVSTIPAACQSAISDAMGSHRGITGDPGPAALNNCVARHGIRVAESYQPASHYWPLQFAETGFYLALALAGYCFRRLRRLS